MRVAGLPNHVSPLSFNWLLRSSICPECGTEGRLEYSELSRLVACHACPAQWVLGRNGDLYVREDSNRRNFAAIFQIDSGLDFQLDLIKRLESWGARVTIRPNTSASSQSSASDEPHQADTRPRLTASRGREVRSSIPGGPGRAKRSVASTTETTVRNVSETRNTKGRSTRPKEATGGYSTYPQTS